MPWNVRPLWDISPTFKLKSEGFSRCVISWWLSATWGKPENKSPKRTSHRADMSWMVRNLGWLYNPMTQNIKKLGTYFYIWAIMGSPPMFTQVSKTHRTLTFGVRGTKISIYCISLAKRTSQLWKETGRRESQESAFHQLKGVTWSRRQSIKVREWGKPIEKWDVNISWIRVWKKKIQVLHHKPQILSHMSQMFASSKPAMNMVYFHFMYRKNNEYQLTRAGRKRTNFDISGNELKVRWAPDPSE